MEKIIGIWDTEGKTYRNTGYLKKKYGDIQGIKLLRGYGIFREKIRLRVVSNFGDGNCGAGEIHTRVRVKIRGDALKFRAHACVFRLPHNRHRQN